MKLEDQLKTPKLQELFKEFELIKPLFAGFPKSFEYSMLLNKYNKLKTKPMSKTDLKDNISRFEQAIKDFNSK